MPAQSASKKRLREPSREKKAAGHVAEVDDEFDLDLSSDIKGILATLQHVRHKAHSEGQKRNDDILNSAATEVKSLLDDAKKKGEKDRQLFFKNAAKTCTEYEAALKSEMAKHQAAFDNFCKEKDAHLQTYNEMVKSFEDTKTAIMKCYEQHRKKEKAAVIELQKMCAEKLATAELSVKKKNYEEKSFSILRKSLGSFLDSESDGDGLDE